MDAEVRSVDSRRGRPQPVDPGVRRGPRTGGDEANSPHFAQVERPTHGRSRAVTNLTRSPLVHSPAHSSSSPAAEPTSLHTTSQSGLRVCTERSRRGRGRLDEEAEGDPIRVNLPEGIPVLTPRASRILLDILIRLTTVETLDAPPEGSCDE